MNDATQPAPNRFVELAAINVSKYIEKKGNLSYLSWAWACDQLLRRDPDAKWEYGQPVMFGETMMVVCTVTAFGKDRTMHLPVMDHRNKAIPNPDAFAVNTAMQRCLVKAIALHGLGLYIYAGEDVPRVEAPGNGEDTTPTKLSVEQIDVLTSMLNEQTSLDDLRKRTAAAMKACRGDKDAHASVKAYAVGLAELYAQAAT